MSGGGRGPGGFRGWLLPAAVVVAGVLVLTASAQRGALRIATLGPTGRIGLILMLVGLAVTVWASVAASGSEHGGRWLMLRLAGVAVCGIGAIMVIYM